MKRRMQFKLRERARRWFAAKLNAVAEPQPPHRAWNTKPGPNEHHKVDALLALDKLIEERRK